MKKSVSILLVLAVSFIFCSCEQAQTFIVTFNCELTHFYSKHTADLDNVKNYISRKGAQKVGSSFSLSIYGKNEAVCIEEADRQAKVYFDNCTVFFRESDLDELLGDETEFEYSFCRIKDNGDTLKVVSYQYNME